jgi:magnesium chelatase family protein
VSLAVLFSRGLAGVDAPLVTVEVHIAGGLPAINIVGLAEAEVKESRDRVRAALQNAGYEIPQRKITINLAPADVPKESARYDLPIALGILLASSQLRCKNISDYEFAGELALTGGLRSVKAAFAMSYAVRQDKRTFILPTESAAEAMRVPNAKVLAANTLLEVAAHLMGQTELPEPILPPNDKPLTYPDLRDVKGQKQAKRALEIAASGRHSLLMLGSPGTGKSMLAQRLPGIMPQMTEAEAIASARIRSLTTGFKAEHYGERVFRAPHHTCSAVALVGGGSGYPRPGEISLAHQGTLFLDELPEFSRPALEAMREPLESGEVHISRSSHQATYPARFMLIAAMNPCPCGYLGEASGRCHCTPGMISRYRQKISGPLLDRIDLQLEVPIPKADVLMNAADGEASSVVQARVQAAFDRQIARQGKVNSDLSTSELDQHAALDESAKNLLLQAIVKLNLSARAHHRILRVARTIADLAQSEAIGPVHLSEAIGYRKGLDRK